MSKKRAAFAKAATTSATPGYLEMPGGEFGNNPKATVGFSEGQAALLDQMLESKDEKRKVKTMWRVGVSLSSP